MGPAFGKHQQQRHGQASEPASWTARGRDQNNPRHEHQRYPTGEQDPAPTLLLPRPPIQRQQEDYIDQEQQQRARLASNKRRRSFERDGDEEEHQPWSRRYYEFCIQIFRVSFLK